MRIGLALIVGFVTAAMLMGILGLATYAGISGANERRAWAFETIVPKTAALEGMQTAATFLITYTDEYALIGSDGTGGPDMAISAHDSTSIVKAKILSQQEAIQASFQAYSQIVMESFPAESKSKDLVSLNLANLIEADNKVVEIKDLLEKNDGSSVNINNPELLAAHAHFLQAESLFVERVNNQLASARAENEEVRNSVTLDLTRLITATLIFTSLSASLTGFAGYMIYRSFAIPLKNLRRGIDRIAKGDFDVKIDDVGRNDEIGSLARAISTMEKELQIREGQKDEFISIASHELRTPIQPILGYALLAKLGKVSPDKAWEAVLKEARRLQQLSSDILDVSKIGSKTLEYRFEKVMIHELLGNIVRSTSLNANSGITIALQFDESQKDLGINADRSRITQVFTNIIENAKKFTEQGEIKVTSEVLANEGIIRVRIIDRGTGIPEEILPLLFRKFATKNHGQAAGQGTGLGLYISKSIVNAHGGDITAWNNNADAVAGSPGATFEITLPLIKTKDDRDSDSGIGNLGKKDNLIVKNLIPSN